MLNLRSTSVYVPLLKIQIRTHICRGEILTLLGLIILLLGLKFEYFCNRWYLRDAINIRYMVISIINMRYIEIL